MSSHAATEPRRTSGTVGAGVRANRAGRRAWQTVWIPEALYRGPHYSDDATTLYTKIAALDARPEGCNASVDNLAAYCGMSKSAAERALKQLNAPTPDADPAWVSTRRRTHRGGRGRTAERYARLAPARAPALLVPVTACEALPPRLFRAYAHLRRAAAAGIPVSAAELAGELFHHSGKHAGQPLSERTGRRLMAELDRLGWITIDHRAGYQGRHLVDVHDSPLRPVPEAAAAVGADNHDGSGPDDHDGSLASKEDTLSPPDQVDHAGGSIRRRRTTGSEAVENPPPPPTFRPAAAAYTGPALQLSPRVMDVLAPVGHLLPGIRTYVLRRIAHEIGRQLDAGTTPARLRARLTHRYATTAPPRDPGRWILGAGLPRHGCALPHCESGLLLTPWAPPEPCHVCRGTGRPPEPGPRTPRPPRPATWCTCPDCHPPAVPAARGRERRDAQCS